MHQSKLLFFFYFFRADQILNMLCEDVEKGLLTGNICSWICVSKRNFTIVDFYEGATKSVIKLNRDGKDLILKTKHAFTRQYDYISELETEDEFTNKVMDIVNKHIPLNWPRKYKSHLIRRIWPLQIGKSTNSSLSLAERRSIWALLQQEEFINIVILPLTRIIPKVI